MRTSQPDSSAPLSPSSAVLAAFAAPGPPIPLSGGRGTSFRVGDLVLKPTGHADEVAWQGLQLADLPEDTVRIALPIPTADGRWVVDGWMATRWLAGETQPGRYADVLAASAAFHAAVAHLPRPAFLDAREDPWSVGDRVAWGETVWSPVPALVPLMTPLLEARRPLPALRSQLVHGDLVGNVLFAAGLPPAILDISPYYRPVGFAAAVVMVDVLVWEGEDAGVLALVEGIPHIDQLLLRAAIYRIVTTGVASADDAERLAEEVRASGEVVRLLVERAER